MNDFQVVTRAFEIVQSEPQSYAHWEQTYNSSEEAYDQLRAGFGNRVRNANLPKGLWEYLHSLKTNDNLVAASSNHIAKILEQAPFRAYDYRLDHTANQFLGTLHSLISVSRETVQQVSPTSRHTVSHSDLEGNGDHVTYLPALVRESDDTTNPGVELVATQEKLEQQLGLLQASIAERDQLRQELSQVLAQKTTLGISMDDLKERVAEEIIKAMEGIATQWNLAEQDHPDLPDSTLDGMTEPTSEDARVDKYLKTAQSNIFSNLEPLLIGICGLERLDIRVGEPYNGDVMQRFTQVATSNPELDGKVARVYTRGYKYVAGPVCYRAMVDVFAWQRN